MDPFERCWCTGITAAEVAAAVVAGCPPTVEEIRRATGACGGCRSCRPELTAFLAGLAPPPPPPHDGSGINEGSP